MSTGVRITGLRETIRSLEKLGVSVEDLKQAMTNTTARVVEEAKQHTPVRTGALQASIRASKSKNKGTIRAGSARVIYASYVEYGSVHNEIGHAITDAVLSNQQYMADQLDSEIRGLVRQYNLN